MLKNIILFPGQGSQYVGMGKELCEKFEIAKKTFEEANDILGMDIQKICFEGGMAKLSQIDTLLEAIFVVNVIGFRCYMEEIGMPPYYIMGHSLGEYAALTCANVFCFSDALKLIKGRALLGKRALSENIGYMSIIEHLDYDVVEQICKKHQNNEEMVGITCYNSFYQTAIGGTKQAMQETEQELMLYGARITPLFTSPPFHSPLMKRYLKEYEHILNQYTIKEPKYQVISNVTGEPFNKQNIKDNLISQMILPVRWSQSISYAWQHGATLGIDLGAQGIMVEFIQEIVKGLRILSYNQKENRQELLAVCKSAYRTSDSDKITQCMKAVVTTPDYDEDKVAYKKINALYQNLIKLNENRGSSKEEQNESERKAIEELKLIFALKKLPQDKRELILKQIL